MTFCKWDGCNAGFNSRADKEEHEQICGHRPEAVAHVLADQRKKDCIAFFQYVSDNKGKFGSMPLGMIFDDWKEKPVAQVPESEEHFRLLMRDITEQGPSDPNHDRTVCVDYDWLYVRTQEAFGLRGEIGIPSTPEKPSRIGESIVLHTVRQTIKGAAEAALENGFYESSQDADRLLELIEEEVRRVEPAAAGVRSDGPLDFGRGLDALDGLQQRFLRSWEGGAVTVARETLLWAWSRVYELEGICAAMLHRWAVVHNLAQVEGPESVRHQAVFGVASLSAEEFIADGGRAGGERLWRQEAAARVLVEVAQHLQAAPIEQGSNMQEQIQQAAEQLSSYPELSPVVVYEGVDVPPEALKPGRIELVEEN